MTDACRSGAHGARCAESATRTGNGAPAALGLVSRLEGRPNPCLEPPLSPGDSCQTRFHLRHAFASACPAMLGAQPAWLRATPRRDVAREASQTPESRHGGRLTRWQLGTVGSRLRRERRDLASGLGVHSMSSDCGRRRGAACTHGPTTERGSGRCAIGASPRRAPTEHRVIAPYRPADANDRGLLLKAARAVCENAPPPEADHCPQSANCGHRPVLCCRQVHPDTARGRSDPRLRPQSWKQTFALVLRLASYEAKPAPVPLSPVSRVVSKIVTLLAKDPTLGSRGLRMR